MSETASSLVKSLRIGRYFNIVSVTTSSILVTFIAGLVAAGALEGTPSLERLIGTIKTLNLADGALFTLGTLLVGLMLHPLQYALVQMLEGYWGGNHVAILAMDAAAVLHVHRWDKLATGYLYAKGLSQGLSSLDDDRVG